jgi:hypothetical protein
MRTVLGTAFLVGVGVAVWPRRGAGPSSSSPSRDGDATPTTPSRRAASPAVRRRPEGTRPPAHERATRAAETQDLDGGVTAAVTGHNPGLVPRVTPQVEDLGVRDGSSGAAYGPSSGDITGIYGAVMSPMPELEGDAGTATMPGDGGPDGQSWTETMIASAAESGTAPYDDYESVAVGRDDDDDVPVADRGAGGLSGL